MPDPLSRLVSSRTLWLVVALPLVSFVAVVARGLVSRARGASGARRRGAWDVRVALAGVGGAFAVTLAQVVHFARISRALQASALVERFASGVHVGALDVGVDLVFDARSSSACTLACGLALAVALFIRSRPLVAGAGDAPRPARAWAWINLALAGSLLSFLAGGALTTALGWTLAAGATAWLAGWTHRRAGGRRATLAAAGLLALLFASSTLFWGAVAASPLSGVSPPDPLAGTPAMSGLPGAALGDPAIATPALVALLVAAAATSFAMPPVGAPLALAALASGATTAAVGPFLLLRLAPLVPAADHGAALVVGAGVLLLVLAWRRAASVPTGSTRWLLFVGGLPPGLTLVSLGSDGPAGAALVSSAAGLVAALLLLVGARQGLVLAPGSDGASGGVDARAAAFVLERAPARAGELLGSFERWVLDATAGAIAALARAFAWAAAGLDVHVASAPADALAGPTTRAASALESVLGGSLVRVAWALAALAALGTFAAAAHALWQRG